MCVSTLVHFYERVWNHKEVSGYFSVRVDKSCFYFAWTISERGVNIPRGFTAVLAWILCLLVSCLRLGKTHACIFYTRTHGWQCWISGEFGSRKLFHARLRFMALCDCCFRQVLRVFFILSCECMQISYGQHYGLYKTGTGKENLSVALPFLPPRITIPNSYIPIY